MTTKKIPTKNYIILGIIVIVTFLLIFYIRGWYLAYQQDRLTTPIINNYISELKFDEFKNYAQDNQNFMVYVGSTDCQTCRDFEVDFAKYIQNHSFKHDIVYLNLTDKLQENAKFLETVQDTFIGNPKLKSGNETVPTIYQFEDGKIKDVVRPRSDGTMDFKQVKKFLEKKHYVNEE